MHQNRWKSILGRSLAIWGVLIAAEILHGILRAIWLVPLLGEFRSNQLGVFTGSLIILLIAYPCVSWIGARRWWELWGVGLLWVGLTVGFELGFGRWVLGLSWERLAADYNLARGGLMPLGLVVLLASPWLVAKWRKSRT